MRKGTVKLIRETRPYKLEFKISNWLKKGFQHSEFWIVCYLLIILSPLFLPGFDNEPPKLAQ